MNDRTGKRPTLSPEDDPSIPVLTERLTLPVPGARPASPPPAPMPTAKTPLTAAPPSTADAVVDSMVFPRATPARKPDAALPAFDLPPMPAAAPAAWPVQPTGMAASAPASVVATPMAPPALPDADAIRNAILDDLAVRLPREIEGLMRRQLAGSIEAAVQAASTDMAARIRNAAAQSLQNLVEQSVKAEIAQLRTPPKR